MSNDEAEHIAGNDGLTEDKWRTTKLMKDKIETKDEQKLSETIRSRVRVYFPLRETVAKSRGGLGVSDTTFRAFCVAQFYFKICTD